MLDVMYGSLHLRGVGVPEVVVDRPTELVVEVVSTRKLSGCPQCGRSCRRWMTVADGRSVILRSAAGGRCWPLQSRSMTYFYNVIITRKSNPSEDVIKLDLLETELQERIMTPYYEGSTIVIRGIQIDHTDIEQIRIYVTDTHSDFVRPKIAQEFRDSGVIFAGSLEPYVAQRGDDVTDAYITSPPGSRPSYRYRDDPKPTQDSGPKQEVPAPDPKKVFVVHGRNSKAREALFHFLYSIGLDPLEWSESRRLTGKPQPYVGEILQTAFATARAVVVLMTPG